MVYSFFIIQPLPIYLVSCTVSLSIWNRAASVTVFNNASGYTDCKPYTQDTRRNCNNHHAQLNTLMIGVRDGRKKKSP